MPLQDSGTAPYAPTHAVTTALDAYRRTGLAITPTNLERLSVPATITPRTMQALKLLDLLNEDGSASEALIQFKQAPTETHKEVLAQTLRAAYAPIFAITGPDLSEISTERVEDAFRHYTPDTLRPRMVNLFLGLAEYVGIIPEGRAPARKPGPKTGRSPQPRPASGVAAKKAAEKPAPPLLPDPQNRSATSSVTLRSGGMVTLTYSADLFDLSSEDREFLFGLIDKVKAYGAQRQLPAGRQRGETEVAES